MQLIVTGGDPHVGATLGELAATPLGGPAEEISTTDLIATATANEPGALASPAGDTGADRNVAADARSVPEPAGLDRGHASDGTPLQFGAPAGGLAEVGGSVSPATAPSGSAGAQPTSSGEGSSPTVAGQLAPSIIAAAQGRAAGRVLSISLSPDDLGRVSITVTRAADGTAMIELGAERMSTMEMLHRDQAELSRALDQAGVGQDSHSLSFAWSGNEAGSGGANLQHWNDTHDPPRQHSPAQILPPSGEQLAQWSSRSTQNGGVDVTA